MFCKHSWINFYFTPYSAMLLGIVLYKDPKNFQNKEQLSGILAWIKNSEKQIWHKIAPSVKVYSMRFNTDNMRLNKPVPSFQYLTKMVFCQINDRNFFSIEIIRVCISCGLWESSRVFQIISGRIKNKFSSLKNLKNTFEGEVFFTKL